MIEYIKIIIIIILIVLIASLNSLSAKNKFRLELITYGLINNFLLIFMIFLISMWDFRIAILLLILFFSIIYSNKKKENFISYYS
jgi:hypothetical protein